MGGEVLREVEEGTAGAVLGVEVQLGAVDVAQLELPDQLVLALKLEFPHLERHQW